MANHKSQAPGDNPGFVYLVKRGPFYKIGQTCNIQNRMRIMPSDWAPEGAYKFPIELIWTLGCADKITTERALQQRHMEYYSGIGEWFELPDDVVEWICKQDESGLCVSYDPSVYRRPMF